MNQVPKPAGFGSSEVPSGTQLRRDREQLGEEKFVEMLLADKSNGHRMFEAFMGIALSDKARNKIFNGLLESGDLHSIWLLYGSYDQPAKHDCPARIMPKRKRQALLRALRKSDNSEFAGLLLVCQLEMSRWYQEIFARIAARNDWDSGFVLEKKSPNITERVKLILLGKADRQPSAA